MSTRLAAKRAFSKTRSRLSCSLQQQRTNHVGGQQQQQQQQQYSNSPENSAATEDDDRANKYRMILLDNEPGISRTSRNHLVLTCGRCHGKVYLKGPKKKSRLPNESSPQPPSSARKRSDNFQQESGDKALGASAHTDGNLQANFEPLPPASSVASRKKAASSASSSLTLLEQRQLELGKKKKSKKNAPPQGKSKLMNFLSSLNDT
eukprot:CAMPEP_0178768208 /NCGR_PEP_ID=MMETSP0744-20121128/20107_1 /TAXON_ID=913974 /ORGANISM="Nitzschia punctata, Strain CCMP561" /LENGTH=205 /DNA_ID=CAMNT_0020424245 /DNA_START=118 /DNA_END=735 /DNA_ORIENTATION=-